MTVLVDDCLWWWRGRQWCHLVSDTSLEELHLFAAQLALSSRAFHGDHYDLHAGLRAMALRAGAIPVSSRELVGRLVGSGLRISASQRRATAVGRR